MCNLKLRNLAILTAIGMALAGVAQAQSDEYEAKVSRFKATILKELPPALVEDPQGVVDNLLGVTLGPQLGQTFDFARVWSSLVGRQRPTLDPECKRTNTPTGEPDQGECMAYLGTEGGAGEYKQLSFSKNIGLGNIKFLSRPPAKGESDETKPEELATSLSDEAAFEQALNIAKILGLADEELALPPKGVPLPVKSLVIGGAEGGARGTTLAVIEPVVIQKVVFLPRGLTLPKPISFGQFELTKVRAPGEAWVALGDRGVQGIGVSNWMELRRNDKPGKAKTADELADEIARILVSQSESDLNSECCTYLIGVSAEPHGTFGVLLPTVQVSVSPLARDPDEDTQTKSPLQTNTAGTIFEVALVKDVEQAAR